MSRAIRCFLGVILLILFSTAVSCNKPEDADAAGQNDSQSASAKKKVLYVDSYHKGYQWSDEITEGICGTLGADLGPSGKSDSSKSSVRLHILRMDTKRNPSEPFKIQAGQRVKAFIDNWRPDVVITSDDNAFKYVIMPYYRNSDLPVVFCGINWDASVYQAPYKNTTGMIEVALVKQLIEYLRQYSKGGRIGYLAADVLTARKEAAAYKKYYELEIIEQYVTTFEQWKAQFSRLQDEVDILIVGNKAGINDWQRDEAEEFVLASTKVPTGTLYDWMMPYSLLGLAKSGKEQGQWAAEAALKILEGAKPSDIDIARNKQGRLILNLSVADKLGIVFGPFMLKKAKIFY